MALPLNQLGSFYFITLEHGERGGAPDVEKQQIEVLQRPGTNSSAFVKFGKKGKPFPMVSFVDAPDFTTAENLRLNYVAAIGLTLDLVWNNSSYTSIYNCRFFVLDVQNVVITRIAGAANGLNVNPQAVIRAVWTLCPVLGS